MTRMSYVDAEELSKEQRDLVKSHAVRPGELLHIRQVIANNLELLEAHHMFGTHVRRRTGLETRERELAILTAAYHLRSEYIWQQHVIFSLYKHISESELRSLMSSSYNIFAENERNLMEYVEKFISQTIDNQTHDQLSNYYSDSEIVGIALLLSYYIGLDKIIDAFDVDIEHEQFVGWKAESV